MNGIVTSSRFFKWIIGIQWECIYIYILLLYIIIYNMYPQMKRSDAKAGCFALGDIGSHQFRDTKNF